MGGFLQSRVSRFWDGNLGRAPRELLATRWVPGRDLRPQQVQLGHHRDWVAASRHLCYNLVPHGPDDRVGIGNRTAR